MACGSQLLATGLAILLLTLFLDLLDLSFGRMLWFVRTLRYWLYFILHTGLSVLTAYLLRNQISHWYLLAPAATFLAVSVISNTDVKLGAYPLIPISQLFLSIKSKMSEQAAQDKANEVVRAQLIERLLKLDAEKVRSAHLAALLAAGRRAESIQAKVHRAHRAAKENTEYFKSILIRQLVGANLGYVEGNISAWERSP